jgi:DNA invertase Pin-like site-specific DNA recombinase
MAKVAVAINDKGKRIGEGHHNSKLSDHEVDLMRELREEHGLRTCELMRKFEVSRTLVKRICRYEIRCQTPDRWKVVEVTDRFILRSFRGGWGFAREELR